MILESIADAAQRLGIVEVHIGSTMWFANPRFVSAVCDEIDERMIYENESEIYMPCGRIETERGILIISRVGEPRDYGTWILWIGANSTSEVEDHIDDHKRIVDAIRSRSDDEERCDQAIQGLLGEAARRLVLTDFDVQAFASKFGLALRPQDSYEVIEHQETYVEARRRQRALHIPGSLRYEFRLEAARDRALELAKLDCNDAERYTGKARECESKLKAHSDLRDRELGVEFGIDQVRLNAASLQRAIVCLRMACDDAEALGVLRSPNVSAAAQAIVDQFPWKGTIPLARVDSFVQGDCWNSLARQVFAEVLNLALRCEDEARGSRRELAAREAESAVRAEYDTIKRELGTF